MRAVGVVPGMTAVLISLVAVAGCSPLSSSSSTATATSQPASPTASASTAVPAVTPPATPTSSSGGVQNLDASAAVKSELLAAYAAARGIPVSDVASKFSVYYAYDPATQTYWAEASFAPTSTDPLSVSVGFQDGGQGGYFKESGSGPWQFQSMGQPAICEAQRFFPQAVLVAWAMPTPVPGEC